MIYWTGIRPINEAVEAKVLSDMCLAYVGICNPQRVAPEPNQITRRCQHCQTVFQQPASPKLLFYCVLCR